MWRLLCTFAQLLSSDVSAAQQTVESFVFKWSCVCECVQYCVDRKRETCQEQAISTNKWARRFGAFDCSRRYYFLMPHWCAALGKLMRINCRTICSAETKMARREMLHSFFGRNLVQREKTPTECLLQQRILRNRKVLYCENSKISKRIANFPLEWFNFRHLPQHKTIHRVHACFASATSQVNLNIFSSSDYSRYKECILFVEKISQQFTQLILCVERITSVIPFQSTQLSLKRKRLARSKFPELKFLPKINLYNISQHE